jgi:hypothetical protein
MIDRPTSPPDKLPDVGPWLGHAGLPPATSSNPRCLSLSQLRTLCRSGEMRDRPDARLRGMLVDHEHKGVFLSVLEGDQVYVIADDGFARRLQFRTVESALAVLHSIPGLNEEVHFLRARLRHTSLAPVAASGEDSTGALVIPFEPLEP